MTTTELKQGRICPVCSTAGEVDDLFCSSGCGHAFSDADPIVMLNADGTLHDPNQVADDQVGQHDQHDQGSRAYIEPDVHQGPTTVVTPTVVVVAPPVVTAPAIPDAPVVVTPADPDGNTNVTASVKICFIDVMVDLEPRPLRPDDVVAPTVATAGYTLSAKSVPFGRLSPSIPILGDQAVSRLHGKFQRTPDGGYELLCETDNFTEVAGVELAKGQTVKLKDGDAIKIGDFFLIVYHEET